jgi:peptide deformylase
MVDKLLIYGDELLRSESVQLLDVDKPMIPDLVKRMFATMREYGAYGLSAIQIGVPKRIATIDISCGENPKDRLVLVNPTVPSGHGKFICKEGCLSIPGFYELVERTKEIDLVYEDEFFNARVVHATGLLARVVQHEIDHMDGKLFLDRISSLKRDAIKRKIAKIRGM